MKTGKITAKLRDAVSVCLTVDGKEIERYNNIKLPDVFLEARTIVFRTTQKAEKIEREAAPAEEAAIPTQAEQLLRSFQRLLQPIQRMPGSLVKAVEKINTEDKAEDSTR